MRSQSSASQVKSVFLSQLETVIRPAAGYDVATTVLFDITGGPVWIWALYAVTQTAEASNATLRHTINGVALDAAAVNCNSGVDDVIVFPLDSSGTGVVVPNVAAECLPEIGSLNAGGGKVIASIVPGEISLVVAAFNQTGTHTFYVHYYRMTEDSLITVA